MSALPLLGSARLVVTSAAAVVMTASAWGQAPCTLPDNGGGSADLPPVGCAYGTPSGDMNIVDGLPVGSSIQIDATLGSFVPGAMGGGGVCSFPGNRAPGGTLGGEKVCTDAVLKMPMIGFGGVAGFNRLINIPISIETHYAPRMLGAPVQSFDTSMFRMFGQITGDPDFDLLRVVAGADFGLPSPGHTTLTQAPLSMWAVDSFFDITYRIDFVGHPGGALSGRSGSTTATVRFQLPDPLGACCNPNTGACALVNAGACAALGGRFLGSGTSCATVTCVPEGACCIGTVCRVVPRVVCAISGGTYMGDGTSCVCAGGGNPCCPADFNGSGLVSVQDIFDFLAAYFAGCP